MNGGATYGQKPVQPGLCLARVIRVVRHLAFDAALNFGDGNDAGGKFRRIELFHSALHCRVFPRLAQITQHAGIEDEHGRVGGVRLSRRQQIGRIGPDIAQRFIERPLAGAGIAGIQQDCFQIGFGLFVIRA